MAACSLRRLVLTSANSVYLSTHFRGFYSSRIRNSDKYRKIVFSAKSVSTQQNIKMGEDSNVMYPVARRDDSVIDNYFGVQVGDPYRWLEDPDSEETKKFIESQNAISKSYLNACPYRQSISEKLKEIWDFPKYSCPFKEGDRYYFYKNTGLQNQSVLYMLKDLNSEEEVFLDPNTLSEDGTVSLSNYEFSEDGSIFAYGLSSKGSDWLSIHFKDVQTRKDYDEVLHRVKFSSISWTHDNKGIFYGMYPSSDKCNKLNDDLGTECDVHQKLYYHRLGTPQEEDILVLEFPEDPKLRISTNVSHCGRYVVVYLQRGCRDNMLHFCDLKKINYEINGKLPITEVVGKLEADYEYVTNTGSEFIFRTNKDAPNYRLIKIDFENPKEENWTTLVEEHSLDVIDWALAVNTDKLIICYIHHVNDILQYHELSDGKLINNFPLDVGNIVGFSGKKKYSEVFYKLTNFLTPGIIYRCDLKDPGLKTEIFKDVKPHGFDREQFETKQVFFASKDGTKIPMFIVHKKGSVKNGKNPCLLYGYGGFNISVKPFFNFTMTILMKHLNGMFAVANIRGGGEYGEKWHNQGRYQNKQNTFDDFQAAAEFLISENYTSSQYLAIKGDSNGGLLVAACAIQRPELYGAVVVGVGVLDMLRFHKFTIGFAWVTDYGSSDTKEQFEYLYKYSPLHNIRIPPNNVQFPAMMLMTADHDDRVVPLHSLKFIATLHHVIRDYSAQKNPLIIRVDTKAGHGSGKPTSKLIEEATDVLCFITQALKLEFKP